MKYYLIVGEASGDLHASRLMRSLKKIDEFAEFRFFGGDLMAACVHHDQRYTCDHDRQIRFPGHNGSFHQSAGGGRLLCPP